MTSASKKVSFCPHLLSRFRPFMRVRRRCPVLALCLRKTQSSSCYLGQRRKWGKDISKNSEGTGCCLKSLGKNHIIVSFKQLSYRLRLGRHTLLDVAHVLAAGGRLVASRRLVKTKNGWHRLNNFQYADNSPLTGWSLHHYQLCRRMGWFLHWNLHASHSWRPLHQENRSHFS